MNALAVILLILAALCLPGALTLGGHQGLTALGVVLTVLAIATQVLYPSDLRASDLFPQIRTAIHHRKAPRP